MNDITKNQEEIAQILLRCKKEGWIPTNRELAKMTKKSFQYINYALHCLEKKGFIRIIPYKKRNIEILFSDTAYKDEVKIIKTIFKYFHIKPTIQNINYVSSHLNGLLVAHIYKENFKKLNKE